MGVKVVADPHGDGVADPHEDGVADPTREEGQVEMVGIEVICHRLR